MTCPSDMTAKAEQVLDLMCCNVPEAGDVRQASIATIAAALTEAREQGRLEGLKRAAEIANEHHECPSDCGDVIRAAILSEIGEA